MFKLGRFILPTLVLLLIGSGHEATAQNTAPARPSSSISSLSLEVLKGLWVRPDGGYLIMIRGIDSAGKLDATYFNPSQLPFSRAEATLKDNVIAVFFELRAGGYAGSNYTLTYDPEKDRLIGIYFQAVAQQKFNIFFVQTK